MISVGLTDDQREFLQSPVTEEKIKSSIFSMKKGNALGPDVFNAEFFTSSWDIVGVDDIASLEVLF